MLVQKDKLKQHAPHELHNHIDSDLVWAVRYNHGYEVSVSWLVDANTLNEHVQVLEKNLNS